MKKYSIGIDYGSLSCRLLLVDLTNGNEIENVVVEYKHKILDKELPNGIELKPNYALQHPDDYIEGLKAIKDLLKKANISADSIVGVGVDFTASTPMPLVGNGIPLCKLPIFENEPHAYPKLWKHHAAQNQADRFNEIAKNRKESFLNRYSKNVSCEWAIPKAMEVCEERLDIYDFFDRWIEASDWIVWQLTGNEVRNSCAAGYKGCWDKKNGYPSKSFLQEINPRMINFIDDKFGTVDVKPSGNLAGYVCEKASKITGLNIGTPVAMGIIDAHVALPACGIVNKNEMLMIIGTSSCHIMMSDKEKFVDGVCGVVEDGVLEGFYAYEAGQASVGDSFEWFIQNCVPKKYYDEAIAENKNLHQYLTDLASEKQIGESGVLALDWWNGNRSVLMNAKLKGVLFGLNLQTKPEDIYRAMIEATAFGSKKIVERLQNNDIEINKYYAAGGIAKKNKMMMQIYADVLNCEIEICDSEQSCALGSAMFGAVVGKYFDDINQASKIMCKNSAKKYLPIKENVEQYKKMYKKYNELYEYFGNIEN